MKKITLFIWQLGVNVIGLPELYKCESIYKISISRYFGSKTTKQTIIERFKL